MFTRLFGWMVEKLGLWLTMVILGVVIIFLLATLSFIIAGQPHMSDEQLAAELSANGVKL